MCDYTKELPKISYQPKPDFHFSKPVSYQPEPEYRQITGIPVLNPIPVVPYVCRAIFVSNPI